MQTGSEAPEIVVRISEVRISVNVNTQIGSM